MSDLFAETDLVALLEPTLGRERAAEVVHAALVSLGITAPVFSAAEATRAMTIIGHSPGFVGSVARFALARFALRDATAAARPRGAPVRPRAGDDAAMPREELTALLAPTLGQEKSDEVVLESLRLRGLPEDRMTVAEGLAVLDHLASTEGLVGVAARFAKAHLLMRSRKG